MDLHLERASEENEEALLALSLYPNQEHFIETVRECLDEAKDEARWVPVGIYDGETLVGFAMYGYFSDETESVWMDRLLIDKAYQGRGYGKEAVRLLLEVLKESYPADKIFLSVYEDNPVAISLYKKMGFFFNGALDTKGEKVMEYDI